MDSDCRAHENKIYSANMGELQAAHLGQDDPGGRPLLARDDQGPLSGWRLVLFGDRGEILSPQINDAPMEAAQTENVEKGIQRLQTVDSIIGKNALAIFSSIH